MDKYLISHDKSGHCTAKGSEELQKECTYYERRNHITTEFATRGYDTKTSCKHISFGGQCKLDDIIVIWKEGEDMKCPYCLGKNLYLKRTSFIEQYGCRDCEKEMKYMKTCGMNDIQIKKLFNERKKRNGLR